MANFSSSDYAYFGIDPDACKEAMKARRESEGFPRTTEDRVGILLPRGDAEAVAKRISPYIELRSPDDRKLSAC